MLEAGKQLDSLVARTVWGFVVIIDTQTGIHFIMGKDRVRIEVPNYSTELAAAYGVVNHMQEYGFAFQLKSVIETGKTKWIACFLKQDGQRYIPVMTYELPQAICLAAISAITGENIYKG